MDFGVAKIGEELRRVLVPGRPHRALVDRELGHRNERVGVAIEIGFIEGAILRHALQLAVGGVGPAMIGAGEDGGVPLLVAAYLHAAMPARVQERVHHSLLVAAQDDRLFTHATSVEIAGIWNKAFMTNEQPGPRKDLVEFLLIEIRIHEDFTGNESLLGINELGDIIETTSACHRRSSCTKRWRQITASPVRTVDIVLEFSAPRRSVSRRRVDASRIYLAGASG